MHPCNCVQYSSLAKHLVSAIVCPLALVAPDSSIAANPRAGLPTVPAITTTAQLQSAFTNVPIGEVRSQAQGGRLEAQTLLGFLYYSGEGLPKDPVLGVEWLRKAADRGFALAQNILGVCYMQGDGVPKDLKEAGRWFRLAADQGLPRAYANLASLIRDSSFSVEKYAEYDRYLELAAEQGELSAACALGWRLLYKPVPGEPIRADIAGYWLRYAAEHGYVPAYNLVAGLYLDHWGTPTDFAEAERWYQKGAEVQDPWCEMGLGMLELRSERPDMAKVRKWLGKAARQDCPQAWYQMGRLLELRDMPQEAGEKPDFAAAAGWYKRAADRGNQAAAKRLAELKVENRINDGEDEITSLRRLADMQDKKAQLELARRYLAGTAKPRSASDSPEALYELLAYRGHVPGMLELSDFCRTGKFGKKDPIHAIYLIHSAMYGYEDPLDAPGRFAELRDSLKGKKPSARIEGLETAFPLYIDAVYNNKDPASAIKIARSYLDGSYPKDEALAAAWFSVAAHAGSVEGRNESERLFKALSPGQTPRAKRMAFDLETLSRKGME